IAEIAIPAKTPRVAARSGTRVHKASGNGLDTDSRLPLCVAVVAGDLKGDLCVKIRRGDGEAECSRILLERRRIFVHQGACIGSAAEERIDILVSGYAGRILEGLLALLRSGYVLEVPSHGLSGSG